MDLLVILLIVILVLGLFGGGYSYWGRTPGTPYAYGPYAWGGGIIWIVLLIVLILLLVGRL
jgi:hypothetical protein